MNIESNETTRKALLLLKVLSQREDDIREGRVRSHAEAMRHMEKKLSGYR